MSAFWETGTERGHEGWTALRRGHLGNGLF